MYAERFTNGPYTIQNDGDQIKITLNVALDWYFFYLHNWIKIFWILWGLLYDSDPHFNWKSM
jgi:hypothetical protein